MDKRRIELIITGVLLISLILAWGNTMSVLKKKKATPKAVVTVPLASVSVPKISVSREIENDKDLSWVRCPFSGKSLSPGASEDMKLNGIIWDEQNPMAVINDIIVKKGDTCDGQIVADIKQDKVILKGSDKEIELRLE